MRAVIQRVKKCSVFVGETEHSAIADGLLVLLGVAKGDSEEDAEYIAEKIVNLRIFPDDEGKMNLSVSETGGGLMVVSQFTLLGDCRKGRRPSFSYAEEPGRARLLYERLVEKLKTGGTRVETGVFGEMMDIVLVNWGPVTLIIDS
ncbi:MAG: D-tyrosyl-tRNA(Tyr) deacylase [Actinobacteria bacterium]|nr:D-tyrosyl-tRNA(Tyr) deacylase [Actinomycetota bacterium]